MTELEHRQIKALKVYVVNCIDGKKKPNLEKIVQACDYLLSQPVQKKRKPKKIALTDGKLPLTETSDRALVRSTDPDTSKMSAEQFSAEQLNEVESQIYAALEKAGTNGATNHELEAITGISLQTITPRPKRMEEKGLIVRAPFQRPNKSGRLATVWVLANLPL